MIHITETARKAGPGDRADKPAEWIAPLWPGYKGMPVGLDRKRKVYAYVNHSRWVADCPLCNGAELVSPNDPRFFCGSCGNDGGTFFTVVFPKDKAAIEAELLKRSDLRSRNWNITESVKKLQAENKERGVV